MEQAQSAGEMIARKLKPFINESRVRTVHQKSSSFAIEKSTNTENAAHSRGAVLAKLRQPKGYLWSWQGTCEVPHLGVAGHPSLPALSHLLLLPQNLGNMIHFNSWLLSFSQTG